RFTGPPLFISGCNRGGTTILSQILASHPHVRNVGRGQFNEGRHVWRRGFRDWSRHRWAVPPWRWILRRTADYATPKRVAFFRNLFESAMPDEGRMLEKTPANAVRIPFIDRLYPDCYFIHVLRDGRHTTASLVARKVWWVYAPHQWVWAHRTALDDLTQLPAHRVVVIRYEELVEDPERVLREICQHCDLPWGHAERNAVTTAARSLLRPVECRWDRFSPGQKRYVLRVIRELQAELGYPVEP
ncbi:MAG TPA: sulfotransferase, partial [Armatimonadota bacterium]|nr:sulfotransferase [Armatimonadota bacterium]